MRRFDLVYPLRNERSFSILLSTKLIHPLAKQTPLTLGEVKLPRFPPLLVRGSYRASHLPWQGQGTVLPTSPDKAKLSCFPPPLVNISQPISQIVRLPWTLVQAITQID